MELLEERGRERMYQEELKMNRGTVDGYVERRRQEAVVQASDLGAFQSMKYSALRNF